ncbi:MAG: esterase family protein [Paludibacteraceae bacterium]|nr:esterase family protein [Paludibacteraceae bacterium]
MNRVLLAVLALLTWSVSVCAKPGYVEADSVCSTAPLITADGNIIISVRAPKALIVELQGDFLEEGDDTCMYMDSPRIMLMKKDSSGVWSRTFKAAQPETYMYNFLVDGKMATDPCNENIFWRYKNQWNIFTIGGTPQVDLYLDNPKGGEIDTLTYYSPKDRFRRRCTVYRPYGYTDKKTYPVIYLLHGLNGSEHAWLDLGRAKQILDNLIASGEIPPVIAVMPDCNTGRRAEKVLHKTLFSNMLNYSAMKRSHIVDVFPLLMDTINSRYSTSTKTEDTYIAGLSAGAQFAADIVKANPDRFSAVGMFSPVVGKREVPKKLEPSENVFYWISIGKKDFFYKNGQKFCMRLEKLGHKNMLVNEFDNGHTWRLWRYSLTSFLRKCLNGK